MPHDDWKRVSVHRDLIERVDVIAVVSLTIGLHRVVRIKGAWCRDPFAAGNQASLALDDQRAAFTRTDGRAGEQRKTKGSHPNRGRALADDVWGHGLLSA
ncbi:hypothetical protein D3C72_2017190 [compost metagenome]